MKLLVCLELLYDNKVPGAFNDTYTHESWANSKSGPYFANWTSKEALGAFNTALRKRGLSEIYEIPIRPSAGETAAGAYVAMWPVGVPHGSSSNKHRRITITLPLNTTGKTIENSRSKKRALALAVIASSDEEIGDNADVKRKNAEAWIASDTVPYADGDTHSKPQYVAALMRHGTGPFARLAPTISQAEKYVTLS
jgi:hypothetical protein